MEDQLLKEDIKTSPCASYWLKEAIEKIDDRDPVDAFRDLEILKGFIIKKLDRIKRSL